MFPYGNHSRFSAGAPQCGAFVHQHAWLHYVFLWYMPIMTLFAILVNGFVLMVLCNKHSNLLVQSQHVYVLGSAITNLCVAIGCNVPAWIDTLVFPCVNLGAVPCFAFNVFNFAGGYQMMTNVCLVCLDRWRLVRLGAAYDHPKEVRRAKWLLCVTSIANLAIFMIPEFVVPVLTGVGVYDSHVAHCRAAQSQTVPQLLFVDVGRFLGWFMIVGPWLLVIVFTLLTIWELRAHYKQQIESGTARNVSQVGDGHKMLHASFVMFGMVIALLLTFGPLALAFLLLDVAPSAISGYQVQSLLYLQFSNPALEPFVFAITLPKLRESARKTTFLGRQLSRMAAKLDSFRKSGTNAKEVLGSEEEMPLR